MFQKEIWDEVWKKQEHSDWGSSPQMIYETLIKEIGNIKGKKILEAGSGTGRISMRLGMEGADVSLLDFSELAIEQSKVRFGKHGVEAEFIVGDIMNMENIQTGKYDVVWNAGVLEHFDYNQQMKSLKEMKRILKPGGLLITLNPNARSMMYRIGKWYMEKTNQWSYGQELPIYTLEPLAKALDINLIEEYSIGLEQTLDFFSYIPESATVKHAFECWFENMSLREKNEMEGYLLVSVFQDKVEKRLKDEKHYVEIREQKEKDTYIILSSVRFREDLWQRAQQVAVQLQSMGKKVIFVNNNSLTAKTGWNIAENGIQSSTLYKYILQSKIDTGITVVNRIDNVEDVYGNKQNVRKDFISYVVNFFKEGKTRIICYLPEYADVIQGLNQEIDVYYDCVDEMTGFYRNRKVVLDEKMLLKKSKGVFVTSKTLFVRKTKLNEQCILVPNAVNIEEYKGEKEKPQELQNMKGPIVGYVGAIANWFDQELIMEVARLNPDMNFVLVGTVYTDVEKMREVSNIHFLGRKEYDEVPNYMKNFDVGIIPFKMEDLIVNTNPIKYFEHLASGIETVTTPLPELIGESYVHLAENPEMFSDKIKNVIRNRKEVEMEDKLKGNTWRDRVIEMVRFMESENPKPIDRREKLKEILGTYSDSGIGIPMIQVLKAEILEEIGERDLAKKTLCNLENKLNQVCLMTRVNLYYTWGEKEKLIQVLTKEEKYRDDVLYWEVKGEKYLEVYLLRKLGLFNEAIARAGELELSDREIYEEIGTIFYDISDYPQATKYYSKAIRADYTLRTREASEKFANIAKGMGKEKVAVQLVRRFNK